MKNTFALLLTVAGITLAREKERERARLLARKKLNFQKKKIMENMELGILEISNC